MNIPAAEGAGVFPPFVEKLPRARLDVEGLHGWKLKGEHGLVVFMKAERRIEVPEHHHGPQWGIVLSGSMELTVEKEARVYKQGDTHYIPAGVNHTAVLYPGWHGLYVFPRD